MLHPGEFRWRWLGGAPVQKKQQQGGLGEAYPATRCTANHSLVHPGHVSVNGVSETQTTRNWMSSPVAPAQHACRCMCNRESPAGFGREAASMMIMNRWPGRA